MSWKYKGFTVSVETTRDVPAEVVRQTVDRHKHFDKFAKIAAVKDLREWFHTEHNLTLGLLVAKELIEEVYMNWEKYNA